MMTTPSTNQAHTDNTVRTIGLPSMRWRMERAAMS